MFKNYRWTVLAMVFLAMIINYMDRAALSVAMPFITKSFDLTPGEKGIIFSSFFIGYACFNFIGGYLSDKLGPKKVFTGTMTIWSIFCGLTALASTFWSMLLVRVCFGIGEGPISTTANKVVNNWFPVKERARAVGINQAGGPLGGALAGPVVGYIALNFSWQASFVVIALLGLIWAFFWHRLASDHPSGHSSVSASELQEILADQPQQENNISTQPQQKISVLQVIMQKTVIGTSLSLFCYNYVLFFFLTWFPSYLIDARNLSLKSMSIVTVIPWLVGALGYMGGGIIIDYIYKITGKQLFSRKIMLITCLIISAICIGFTGLTETAVGAVALMTVAIGFLMLTASAYWAIIQDNVTGEHVGTAGGFMHGMGNISGIVGPTITGFIIQSTGTYTSAFILAGILGAFGALSIALLVKAAKESQPA